MKKRVALIWPRGLEPAYALPLPYASIVSNTPAELCEFRLFDLALDQRSPEELGRQVSEFRPDLICITSCGMNFRQALEAVRAAKAAAPEAVVVAGGPHASAWPKGVLKHPEIDLVIKGEADFAFGALVRELGASAPAWEKVPGLVRREGGRLMEAAAAVVDDLDSLALPDYRFIRLDEYLRRGYGLFCDGRPNAPIQTSRGCPGTCAFCGVSAVSGRLVRHFSTAYTMRWIEALHKEFGIQWFNIIDDNFTDDPAHARAFCEAALRLKIPGLRFGTPNGIRMQRGDAELWRLMKRTGWEHLVVAPESGSAKVLDLMDKKLKPGEIGPILADIRSAGLRLRAFFIIGYPGETSAELKETLALMKRGGFDYIELLFFQPIPGTAAFEKLVAAGEINEDFLPSSFSFGERAYISKDLADVNFPLLFFKVKLADALKNPGNLWRLLRRTNPRATARKLAGLFFNMLGHRRKREL
ncbi:MAG: B12-binding domain-containing radical SAM protein [Elusimicrobia bacterium]|nr:B12-binding domain-containing radical SAM protein [Elusimicrobiota bacterium]